MNDRYSSDVINISRRFEFKHFNFNTSINKHICYSDQLWKLELTKMKIIHHIAAEPLGVADRTYWLQTNTFGIFGLGKLFVLPLGVADRTKWPLLMAFSPSLSFSLLGLFFSQKGLS